MRNRADDTYDETVTAFVDGWCCDFVPFFFNVRCVYVWETMGAFTGVNGVNIKPVGVFLLFLSFFFSLVMSQSWDSEAC